MNKWFHSYEVFSVLPVLALFNISMAASRIVSCCNLSFGLSVFNSGERR